MATMNISIPDEMKAFVEEEAARQGFGSVSEYVRMLIRAAYEQQKERTRVDALLLAGLDSGTPDPLTAGDWESIREAVRSRHAARQDQGHGSKGTKARQVSSGDR